MRNFDFWRPHLEKAHVNAWANLTSNSRGRVGPTPKIIWCNRLTKTAGKAYFDAGVTPGYIKLSSKVFWQYPEGFVREIIAHELAHIAAQRLFGDHHHRAGWKQCMTWLDLPAMVYWCPDRMLQHREYFNEDNGL